MWFSVALSDSLPLPLFPPLSLSLSRRLPLSLALPLCLVQAGPAVVISFGIAAAACALDALCYAELGSRIPRSGSAYLYARVAFGEAIALITGANLLFDYGVGAAAISRSLVGYISRLLHDVGLVHTPGKDRYVCVSSPSTPLSHTLHTDFLIHN